MLQGHYHPKAKKDRRQRVKNLSWHGNVPIWRVSNDAESNHLALLPIKPVAMIVYYGWPRVIIWATLYTYSLWSQKKTSDQQKSLNSSDLLRALSQKRDFTSLPLCLSFYFLSPSRFSLQRKSGCWFFYKPKATQRWENEPHWGKEGRALSSQTLLLQVTTSTLVHTCSLEFPGKET